MRVLILMNILEFVLIIDSCQREEIDLGSCGYMCMSTVSVQ